MIVQLVVWWAVSPKILVTVIKVSIAPMDMALCCLVVATNILQKLEVFIFMVKKSFTLKMETAVFPRYCIL